METLSDLNGTTWAGQGELWLDDVGNDAELCDCTLSVEEGRLRYTWSYQGKPQQGSITLAGDGVDFHDTWHASTVLHFPMVKDSWALIDAQGTYPAGDGPPWGWRVILSLRPSGELVLQMTNITPWGEDGRAVRMIGTKT